MKVLTNWEQTATRDRVGTVFAAVAVVGKDESLGRAVLVRAADVLTGDRVVTFDGFSDSNVSGFFTVSRNELTGDDATLFDMSGSERLTTSEGNMLAVLFG